jgi:ABC-type xylose transport system permease subunit
VHSEDLTIGPETRIAGTLIYRGPEAPQVPEGAVIAGGVDYRESSSRHYFDRAGNTVRDTAHVAGSITWFIGSFLAAAVFALAFPEATARATDLLRREPLKAIALGFAILVCVPLAGVLLVVTIIGIPLALLLVPLYLLLMFLGWVTTALFLGRRGLEAVRGAQPATRGWTLGALLAALVVLWLLRRVPLIGGWIAFIALVAGIGALVWQAWSRREAALRATV